MVREIVTLQLGELSNYVATHFWNTQESYFTYGDEKSPVDHNVHWRQGIGAAGEETFLPRTLIYDFRGSFGAMGRGNPLYGDGGGGESAHSWHGEPSVHKQDPIPKSEYHDALDRGTAPSVSTKTVRYWSDFSRTYFHPRSVVQVSDLEASTTPASSTPTLDTFEHGRSLFAALDAGEDVLDQQLRPFAEECDHLQGLQVIGGGDDGWGGFGSAMLEKVRDEYGKTCVWYWMPEGISSGGQAKQLPRMLNRAKTLAEVCSQATTVIPLSAPSHTRASYALDPGSKWHVSALLSAALESATLPTRLLASPPSLPELSEALNVQGRRTIARLRMGVGGGGEGPAADGALDIDFLNLTGDAAGRGGGSSQMSSSYGRVLSQRGEHSDGVYDALFTGDPPHPPTTRYTSPLPYPLPDSFPRIFTPAAGRTTLTVDTLLSADPQISASATALRGRVLPYLRGDERELVGNALAEIGEEYHEGWDSEDSEDD